MDLFNYLIVIDFSTCTQDKIDFMSSVIHKSLDMTFATLCINRDNRLMPGGYRVTNCFLTKEQLQKMLDLGGGFKKTVKSLNGEYPNESIS